MLAVLRATSRRRWLTTFILLVALGGSWAVATPLFGSPDETNHVLNAAAVVRGEILGPRTPGATDQFRRSRVPRYYVEANRVVFCYAFHSDIPASCASYPPDNTEVEASNRFASYPPLYYAIVGPPSLLGANNATTYAMRLLSVVLSAGLMASGVASLARRRFSMVGVLFALSPMVLFLAGTVNPNGLEIAAGLSCWASALALALGAREGTIDRTILRRVVIAASVLALARQLGPLWLALIGLMVAIVAGREALARLTRDGRARIGATVIVGAVFAQLAWVTVAGTFAANNYVTAPDDASTIHVVITSFGIGYRWILQMIGFFGWLDARPPVITYVLWIAVLGGLIFAAFTSARRSALVALALTIAVVALLPSTLQAYQAHRVGFIWQGRYTLPFAVGVPILAATIIPDRVALTFVRRRRIVVVLGTIFCLAQFLAFAQSLRRAAVGANGTLVFFTNAAWSPPVPILVVLAVAGLSLVALAGWLLSGGPQDPSLPEDRPSPSEVFLLKDPTAAG